MLNIYLFGGLLGITEVLCLAVCLYFMLTECAAPTTTAQFHSCRGLRQLTEHNSIEACFRERDHFIEAQFTATSVIEKGWPFSESIQLA